MEERRWRRGGGEEEQRGETEWRSTEESNSGETQWRSTEEEHSLTRPEESLKAENQPRVKRVYSGLSIIKPRLNRVALLKLYFCKNVNSKVKYTKQNIWAKPICVWHNKIEWS